MVDGCGFYGVWLIQTLVFSGLDLVLWESVWVLGVAEEFAICFRPILWFFSVVGVGTSGSVFWPMPMGSVCRVVPCASGVFGPEGCCVPTAARSAFDVVGSWFP